MEKQIFLRVPKHIVSLAAVLITFFFSIAAFTTGSNDEGLYFLTSQYLSSEGQDAGPPGDDQAPSRTVGVVIFSTIPENQPSSDYRLEGELRLRLSSIVISSQRNRAPPPKQ